MRRSIWAGLVVAMGASGALAGDGWRSGSLDEAFEVAAKEGKPLVAFFWWQGSEHAEQMRAEVLRDPKVEKALAGFVRFDARYDQPGMAELFQQFAIPIAPSTLFFTAEGEPEDLIHGAVDSHALLRDIERIREGGEGTVRGLRRAIAECRDDEEAAELSMSLAGKYDDFGDRAQHDVVLASICELDPRARTLGGCRAHLMRIRSELYASLEGEGPECKCGEQQECEAGAEGGEVAAAKADGQKAAQCEGEADADCCAREQWVAEQAKGWDLAPVYALAKSVKPQEGKFEVWTTIASLEQTRGDVRKRFAALKEASKFVAEGGAYDWCRKAADDVLAMEDELDSKHRKFALELARRAVQAVETRRSESTGKSVDWDQYLAATLNTYARALALNGKRRDAIEACERAMELHGSEEIQATLVSLKG